MLIEDTKRKDFRMTYQLEITSNGGYGVDQVSGITVGELINILSDYDKADEIVLHDEGNRYGASFGYTNGEINETKQDD